MKVPYRPIQFTLPSALPGVLRETIVAAKDGDPMAPVWVLVPGAASAQSLARWLGLNGGVINVRFLTLKHLAELLTQAEMQLPAKHQFLGDDVRREVARMVSSQARHPLDGHASPVLVKSLSAAFDNLRNRSDAEVDRIADSSPLCLELVRMYREFRSAVTGRFVDRRDVIETAAASVDSDGPPVIAIVAEPLEHHEQQLFDALARVQRLHTIALQTGDVVLDDPLRITIWGLGEHAGHVAARSPVPERIIVAPDAQTEVQLGISALLESARTGTPFNRMALLFPSSAPYPSIAHEELRAAGIPSSGRSPLRLGQTAGGRFLGCLMQALANDLEIGSVEEWLAAAPVRDPHTKVAVSSDGWMQVARRARVGRGIDQWTQRLEAFAVQAEQRSSTREQAQVARDCAAFMSDMWDWAKPGRATWSGWTSWLQSGIDRYLGTNEEREGWPREQGQSLLGIEQCLNRMSDLDAVGAGVDREAFAAALQDELLGAQRSSSNGGGVFVGTPGDGVGARFDVVIVCGLAEGVMPGPPKNDGLTVALRVPGEELRGDRERRSLPLAMGGANTVVLTCPRADQRGQRERRPSPWLLDFASARAGARVGADDLLNSRGRWPWLDVIPSFTASLKHDATHANVQLSELAGLQRWTQAGHEANAFLFAEGNAAFVTGLLAMSGHEGPRLSRFDGFTGPQGHLQISTERPLKPTALEQWAECPQRYFLSSVLQVGEPERDDDPFVTSPIDKGMIVHSAMEQFFHAVAPRSSPDQPWADAERDTLHRLVTELTDKARDSGRAPHGLLSEIEQRQLHDHIDALLDNDEEMRAELGVVTVAVELEFGLAQTPPVEVSRRAGAPVAFKGRIDRVDRSLDGSVVSVIDYKTGKASRCPSLDGDPVAGGTKLQAAIYAQAVTEATPQANVVASYWFVTDKTSGYQRKGIRFDAATRERLSEVVGTMAGGIEQGVFPAVPGDDDGRASFSNCRHCPYDDICPSDRDEKWARKSSDPAVASFSSLASGLSK